jgi:predicted phage tail protein
MYDILTNKTYGLGVDEANIDKFKFHRVAKYCDACDDATGAFSGVEGLADGTFRHKPRDLFTSVRETLIGIPEGTKIIERRFTFNGIIQDQGQALDVLNQMAASIRAALVYSGGKITLAVDLPDETPVALFNETNIKTE